MLKTLLISLLLATPLFAQNWELNLDTTFPEEFYMQDTVLIRPTEYPGLPKQIGLYLEKKWNAMIPQVSASVRYDLPRPHNVLRGNFDGNGIDDWVVIYFERGKSGREYAGHVLFIDGKIKEFKFPDGDGEYIKYVDQYDKDTSVFEQGTFFCYLEEIKADTLNGYKYNLEIMEEDYRKWVETAMPFKHSGFKTRFYDDIYNIYGNYFYYFSNGELNQIGTW